MLPGLKTEGIRAVDCDKLPLAGEGEVWFEEQWQQNWELSELREIRLARKGSGPESLEGRHLSNGTRKVIWVSLRCQIIRLQYFPFLSEGEKIQKVMGKGINIVKAALVLPLLLQLVPSEWMQLLQQFYNHLFLPILASSRTQTGSPHGIREQVWVRNGVSSRLFRVLLPFAVTVCFGSRELRESKLILICAPPSSFLWQWVLYIIVEEHGKLNCGWLAGRFQCTAQPHVAVLYRHAVMFWVISNPVPCLLQAWHKHLMFSFSIAVKTEPFLCAISQLFQ